jgi:ABC-type Fe3+-hydroxamate transport system substrate-binding protein
VRKIVDHTGKFLSIPNRPQRIISLVPSITELLFDLGLNDRVIGITKFCIHPHEWFITKTRAGGTKNVKIETIQRLQPDLIIANKEENVKEQIEFLEKNWPVFTTVVDSVGSALKMIRDIGNITGTEIKANTLIYKITQDLKIQNTIGLNTLYLIWKEPYMAAGGDTFISDMMNHAGFRNAIQTLSRYPILSEKEIRSIKPEIILLSSEPYPFKEKHIQELQIICPCSKILLADGEMFSWYGSRMQYTLSYFNHLRQSARFNHAT